MLHRVVHVLTIVLCRVKCRTNFVVSHLLQTKFFLVCFLLGYSPASEFYIPTFGNTLFHLHRQIGVFFTQDDVTDGTYRVFRNVGI